MNKKIVFIFPKDSSAIFDKKSIETFGGATVQMFLLAKEFSNYEDVVVSSLVVDLGQKNEDIINGLKLYKTFSKKDNLLLKILKFHKAIQKVKPDAIIQHGLTIFSCLLAVYCKIFKIKFVYMFASDVEADGYYQTDHKKARLLKLLINYGDILVTQNQYQHDKILNKYNRKTNKLYSGFPIENSYSNNQEFVLWVAMCGKWKRPDKFIKLASLNSNYKFVIVCNKVVGQEDYFSNIQQLAEDVGKLEFLRRVPFGKIETYFKKAKIFVNTSDYEGFPQTFIQATKNKVPIISLNVNPDNFITKYKCGIYCNGNEKWMNQSIRELLKDPQKYSSLSENAYQYAKKNHDIKKNAKYLYNLIFDEFMKKNKKIKICFISTYAYPLFDPENFSTHGGSELQLYLITKELSRNKDFEISFVTGNFGQKNIENYGKIKLFKSFNPKPNDNLLKKFVQAILYYRLFKRINADIYFTSAANSTVGLVSLFCKLNNKKHIHRTAHELEVNLSYTKKGILGRIFIWGLEKSNIVVTQNENHKKLLKKNHNIDAVVLRNSIIIEKRVLNNKRQILWIARCDYWKRPELFMQLSKDIPDERFILIAPPANEKEGYQKEIKEKADKIENLTFIDRVPFNEIQKYFDAAKIFVNTSEYEGFPNTFLQAGIGKTPILSLNVNPDNFITKYNCGCFCENDFDKLVENAKLLIYNKEVWKEKSENIFKYVKEDHDIRRNAERLRRVIYNLVGVKS